MIECYVYKKKQFIPVVSSIWTRIRSQFDPWISPMSADATNAIWIQQLASESQKVLLPWAPSDTPQASQMCDVFQRLVTLLQHTVPAPKSAVALAWEFYCEKLAKTPVKDYVLAVVHQELAKLPWSSFHPR